MIPNEMLDEIALFVLIFTSILIFYVAIAKRDQSLISDWASCRKTFLYWGTKMQNFVKK